MPKLKNKIILYLSVITLIVFVMILALSTGVSILTSYRSVERDADGTFTQIEQILEDNQAELEALENDYYETSEKKAAAAAHLIDEDPDMLDDVAAMKSVAELIEVDEIHIFDEKGVIIAGTNPEYYGKSMNSGAQIGYFKQMLKDKTLSLVQGIMTNTLALKSMQYSAVWNETGEYIVQIGINPTQILRMTEKNSLSHIFSLLRVGGGVDLYAIDIGTGIIKGTTNSNYLGRTFNAIGLPRPEAGVEKNTSHATVNGTRSYCVFTTMHGNYIGYVVTRDYLFSDLTNEIAMTAAGLVLTAIILVIAVTWYLNRYVIKSIDRLNKSLYEITLGNLNVNVDVSNTAEFSELSSHINEMIGSLLSTTDIVSYIINKTGAYVGVYVYNTRMRFIRFTDYIPELLRLDPDEMEAISTDYQQFKDYIRMLRSKPLSGEKNIYIISGADTRYIRIDEAIHNHDVLGIVVDMTAEIEKRRRLETERDIDLLTGLLNRRGLKAKLNAMFKEPDALGYGALFMIDADDLKKMNDIYGHSQGDRYLKALADVISKFGSKHNISARLGGDEFVLFLYGYDSEETLMEDVKAVIAMQDMITTNLGDSEEVLVRFSLGYSLTYGKTDHTAMLKAADDMMYENKHQRKGNER